jgi:hypothetical protein
MGFKGFLGVSAACCLVMAPFAALAWSNQGHMVTGAIAYDDLRATDPALVADVETIMKAHPDWARFERSLAGYTGEARTRRLFELMARWPDDARGGPYDHPAWHYWLRVVPSVTDPAANVRPMLTVQVGEAREAYAVNLATVQDRFAPAADRAVALCWLFHLAGDIQQPLHGASLVSGRFPQSDEAGAIDMIRATQAAPAVSMHAYWDDVVGGDGENNANVEATRLRLEKAWPRASLPELNGLADRAAFSTWADESLGLARSVAYDDGRFQGSATSATAVALTAEMRGQWQAVGERRVAVSGHRIADAVRAALAP